MRSEAIKFMIDLIARREVLENFVQLYEWRSENILTISVADKMFTVLLK